MPDVDGIPVPTRSDPADAPAQMLAMAEGIDLRIDGVDGQADTDIAALTARIVTLESEMTALQVSTGSTQTDLDSLEQQYADLLAHTKIDLIRIEVRSFSKTTDSRGFFSIVFAKPFKKTPIVLLTPGSGYGMAAANGAGWTAPAAPGPYTHDNSYGGWIYAINSNQMACGGMKPSTRIRMNYVAFGEAQFTDRSADLGGPGWDVVTPPF